MYVILTMFQTTPVSCCAAWPSPCLSACSPPSGWFQIFFLEVYKYFPHQTAPGCPAAAGAAGPRAADAGARGGLRGGAAGAAVLLGDGGALQHRHRHPLHPRHGRARPRHQQRSVLRVCCILIFHKRSQYLKAMFHPTQDKRRWWPVIFKFNYGMGKGLKLISDNYLQAMMKRQMKMWRTLSNEEKQSKELERVCMWWPHPPTRLVM